MQARINGISMNYEASGNASGPAVVLHHPLATDLTFWDELTPVLAPNYRVVRFDARGHGKSEAPAGRYDFRTLAQDVVSLMDHLDIRQAGYVGLSMGGMVGQALGLHHPDRFNCLALVSTTSRIPPEFRALWSDRVKVAREQGMTSQVEPAMQRWLSAASRANRPDLVARFTRMIETTPIEGYAGWCGAIEHLDFTQQLSAISLPTRVIVGAEDPATTPAAAEVIHKAIAGSDMVVIPGVSHQLSAEDPETFHSHLLPFLDAYVGAA
jgi:3-oxoadipate enol-lactonase